MEAINGKHVMIDLKFKKEEVKPQNITFTLPNGDKYIGKVEVGGDGFGGLILTGVGKLVKIAKTKKRKGG